MPDWSSPTWLYAAVAILSAALAAAELASRYPDNLGLAFRTPAAFAYLGLNIFAGAGVLWLAHAFRLAPEPSAGLATAAHHVVLAVFAGSVLLRSSVFTASLGGQDAPIGPAAVLNAVRQALDRFVDRQGATSRSIAVQRLMRNVSLDEAGRRTLVRLLESLSPGRHGEDDVLAEVAALDRSGLAGPAKSLALGFALVNRYGIAKLEHALSLLGPAPLDMPRMPPPLEATPAPILPADARSVFAALIAAGRCGLDELRAKLASVTEIESALGWLRDKGLVDRVEGPQPGDEFATFLPSVSGLQVGRTLGLAGPVGLLGSNLLDWFSSAARGRR